MEELVIRTDIEYDRLYEALFSIPGFSTIEDVGLKIANALGVEGPKSKKSSKLSKGIFKFVVSQWVHKNPNTATIQTFCDILKNEIERIETSDLLRGTVLNVGIEDTLTLWKTGKNGDGRGAKETDQSSQLLPDLVFNETEILGKGGSNTTVYKGRFGYRDVAIKQLISKDREVKGVLHEIQNLSQCDSHENVVRYYWAKSSPYNGDVHQILIAMELCQTTLADCISGRFIFETTVLSTDLMLQITKGISHLHSMQVVHGNINPSNVFLMQLSNGNIRIKISVFGASRLYPDYKTSTTLNESSKTDGWFAPELINIQNGPMLSFGGDIFSLGLVFYYTISKGHHLFGLPQFRRKNLMENKPQFELEKIKRQDLAFIMLIREMTNSDSESRPSAASIVTHHAFWSNSKTLHFLLDVGNLLERIHEDSQIATSVRKLEGNELMLPYHRMYEDRRPVNGWAQFLCPVLQKHVTVKLKKRTLPYDTSLVSHLFRLIRNLYNHYKSQPAAVKSALGNLSDGFLRYWLLKFPFLVESAHAAFEGAEIECGEILNKYYINCAKVSSTNLNKFNVLVDFIQQEISELNKPGLM